MEAAFFMTEDALKRVDPGVRFDEVVVLNAFDANRTLVHRIATRVYARGQRGPYDLIHTDF